LTRANLVHLDQKNMGVRRQSFWEIGRHKIREVLARLVVDFMRLAGGVASGDCLTFDPFPFDQNGLAPPGVDVGERQIADALGMTQVIVVSDEGLDLASRSPGR